MFNFKERDKSRGVFHPVANVIDSPAASVRGQTPSKKDGGLQSESVFYMGYYTSHEQSVDEEIKRREQDLRSTIVGTLDQAAKRFTFNENKLSLLC